MFILIQVAVFPFVLWTEMAGLALYKYSVPTVGGIFTVYYYV